MKLWLLFTIVTSASLYAQDQATTYRYVGGTGCFVKRYHNKTLEVVPDSTIHNMDLITAELKRNPQFRAFKVNGDLHITPKECLKVNSDTFDELENFALNNEPRDKKEEEEKSLNEVIKEERKSTPKSNYNINGRKKYFIEFGGGVASVSDKKQVIPDYSKAITNIAVNPTTPDSSYKSDLSLNATLGWKASNQGFYMIRIRTYGGEKTDTITDNSSNQYLVTYTDKSTSALFGYKYLFSPNNAFSFFGNLLGGFNMATLKLSSSDSSIQVIKNSFESTSIQLDLEIGAEYMFNSNVGVNFNLGYDYSGPRTWKLKGSEDQNGNNAEGFKSTMSYSALTTIANLIVYF